MTTNNIPPALKAAVRATETHCFRCGQPINWATPFWDEHGNPNPEAGTVEHIIPRARAPHLARERANCAASHQLCNSQAGDRDPRPLLGQGNRDW